MTVSVSVSVLDAVLPTANVASNPSMELTTGRMPVKCDRPSRRHHHGHRLCHPSLL